MPASPPPPPSQSFRLAPLLLCILLSTMAMMAFVALIGPLVRRLGVPEMVAGMAMASGGVFWMLMAQWWGRQSDRHGRKPVLLVGMAVFALAYAGLAAFVDLALHHTFSIGLIAVVLVVGRAFVGGFFGAVPATCAALIADHTTAQTRHLSMAKLSSAMALGMVLGPSIISYVTGFGLEWGFYANAALPMVALAFLALGLPASERNQPGRHPHAGAAAASGKLSLFDRRLRMACFTSFTTILTMSVTQVCLGFFVMDRLHLAAEPAARTTGLALAGVGVAMMVAQQMVLRMHRVSVPQWIVAGALIGALGFGAMTLVHSRTPLLAVFALGAFGVGMLFPCFQAMAANAVSSSEQGRAAGAVSTFQGLGMAVGPVIGTAFYALGPAVPYVVIAVLLVGLAATMARHSRTALRARRTPGGH